MGRRSFSVWIAIAGVWLLSLSIPAKTARADGCVIPPIELARADLPAIPLQRAVLIYKNQTERLIIESSVSGEGQRFGWIVPVPAKPMSVDKVSPGLLNTLSIRTRPYAFHDLTGLIIVLAVPAWLVSWWAVSVIMRNPLMRADMLEKFRPILRCLLLLIVVFVLLSSMTLGSLGGSTTTDAAAGVDVWTSQTIGNYDVTTLQASSPDDLNRWLGENRFAPFPAHATPVLKDYIANGWYFIAAKLQRSGDGILRPHPLSVTFHATTPIYPMRLTALSGAPVNLELFVIADQQAATDNMVCDLSAVLRPGQPVMGPAGSYEAPLYANRKALGYAGLIDAHGVLWDGCCLTRLSGIVRTEDMRGDFALRWIEPVTHQRCLFSHQGAVMVGFCAAEVLWVLGLIIAFFQVQKRYPAEQRPRAYLLRAALPMLMACVLVTGLVYLLLPKTAVTTADTVSHPQALSPSFDEAKRAIALAHPAGDVSLTRLRDGVAEYFRSRASVNAYTYAQLVEEDSPGNYTIEEQPEGFLMRWYWIDMSAWEVFVPKDPVAYRATHKASETRERYRLVWESDTGSCGPAWHPWTGPVRAR